MPIRTCTLNSVCSLDDLYDQLQKQLALPPQFGRNLDALWDVLSTDIEGPFEIVWKKSADSKKVMGADFERVMRILRELEQERDDFKLKLEK